MIGIRYLCDYVYVCNDFVIAQLIHVSQLGACVNTREVGIRGYLIVLICIITEYPISSRDFQSCVKAVTPILLDKRMIIGHGCNPSLTVADDRVQMPPRHPLTFMILQGCSELFYNISEQVWPAPHYGHSTGEIVGLVLMTMYLNR